MYWNRRSGKMKQVKRIIGLLLAVAMLTTMVPAAFTDARKR